MKVQTESSFLQSVEKQRVERRLMAGSDDEERYRTFMQSLFPMIYTYAYGFKLATSPLASLLDLTVRLFLCFCFSARRTKMAVRVDLVGALRVNVFNSGKMRDLCINKVK